MADVTISQLTEASLNSSIDGFIPAVINNTTQRVSLSSISNVYLQNPDRPFIIANASNPGGMSKTGSTQAGFVANEAQINTAYKYTSNYNTMLNPSTYEITIPKSGIYLVQPALAGYVPNSNYNIRAATTIVNVNGGSDFITNYTWFNCSYAGGTNTHWRHAPTYYYPLNIGDKLKMYYGMYGGTTGYNADFFAIELCYITVCMIG